MTLNPFLCIDLSISDSLRSVRKSVLIYEAINKVVFIIRKDIFKEFEEIIGNRIKEQIDVEYVFQ